jgi:hypothetical protein
VATIGVTADAVPIIRASCADGEPRQCRPAATVVQLTEVDRMLPAKQLDPRSRSYVTLDAM